MKKRLPSEDILTYEFETQDKTACAIVYADGNEVLMPTEFDDTTPMADRVYDDCSPDAAHNSQYLEDIMVSCGFWGYWGEWWHYTDNTRYPVEEVFNPGDLP